MSTPTPRAAATEDKVPLLDLEQATAKWLEETGDQPSKAFFTWGRAEKKAAV